jgi:hypothetical protein
MTTPSGGAAGASTDADLIRAHLTALGLSQREAARRLGVDERTMRYYCAGRESVPAAVMLALQHLRTGAAAPSSAAPASLVADAPASALQPAGRNLFKPEWSVLESDDLRVLLEHRIGGPGQSSGEPDDHRFYLPLAGNACRVVIRFKGTTISALEPGAAFDAAQWSEISATVDALLHTEPDKIGRDIAFSAFRVTGWWRGERSGVQILPPPDDAPAVPRDMGQHPFILEFPMHSDSDWRVMNLRRRREHRRLTLLLNVLLRGRVNCETRQVEQAWAVLAVRPDGSLSIEPQPDGALRSAWLQLSYITHIGQVIVDADSQPTGEAMAVLEPEPYHARVGHDGGALDVPADLDDLICRYCNLPLEHRARFDRALFWLDLATRQWPDSMSASFASLMSAIESLTVRGATHKVHCSECGEERPHDVPGPTALFREFFETYAPGASQKKRRAEMYDLRSGISHGTKLIAFDEGRAWGWDPPWANQAELHGELWTLTRVAMRNYLRNPGGVPSPVVK